MVHSGRSGGVPRRGAQDSLGATPPPESRRPVHRVTAHGAGHSALQPYGSVPVRASFSVGASASRARWRISRVMSFSRAAGVSCSSRNACMLVGDNFGPAAASWDGRRRHALTLTDPAPPNATNHTSLYGVSCTSSTSCIAVGSYETATTDNSASRPFAESWNGAVWSLQATPTPPGHGQEGGRRLRCDLVRAARFLRRCRRCTEWPSAGGTLRRGALVAATDTAHERGAGCATRPPAGDPTRLASTDCTS